MKTIYTVYQLNEKVNKLGNPYIGFTDNLIRRAKGWKRKLNLNYIPELIPLYTDTSAQRAFDWEQNKRVENGWRRERPLSHLRKITKKANKILQDKEHQTNAAKWKGKKGLAAFSEEQYNNVMAKAHAIARSSLNNFQKNKKTCIYCGLITNAGNIGRHHNENCKSKPIIDNTL